MRSSSSRKVTILLHFVSLPTIAREVPSISSPIEHHVLLHFIVYLEHSHTSKFVYPESLHPHHHHRVLICYSCILRHYNGCPLMSSCPWIFRTLQHMLQTFSMYTGRHSHIQLQPHCSVVTAGIIINYLLLVFTKQMHVMNYRHVEFERLSYPLAKSWRERKARGCWGIGSR